MFNGDCVLEESLVTGDLGGLDGPGGPGGVGKGVLENWSSRSVTPIRILEDDAEDGDGADTSRVLFGDG